MSRAASSVRAVAVLALIALVILVALVGVAATVAELRGVWTAYLGMEKVITAATPVALGLLVVSVVSMFGLVVLADR